MVKEEQRAQGLILGRSSHLSLARQMGQELGHPRFAEVAWVTPDSAFPRCRGSRVGCKFPLRRSGSRVRHSDGLVPWRVGCKSLRPPSVEPDKPLHPITIGLLGAVAVV